MPPLEPCGCSRESYYEQKLLLGLPWHCYKKPAKVFRNNESGTRWFFQTEAPYTPEDLQRFTMMDRALDKDGETFENMCLRFEQAYAADARGLLCECCSGTTASKCEACLYATGWHVCDKDRAKLADSLAPGEAPDLRWREGTLHGGKVDVQSNLWTLARRLVPLHVLKEKLDTYVREGHIEEEDKDNYVEVFEKMVSIHRQSNLFGNTSGADAGSTDPDEENRFMSMAELQEELESRERLMQMLHGEEGQLTDQWRVYQEIISKLDSSREALRMVVQASAGTGKSFLLETVFMWCILKGHDVQAAAPTGIAAARLRVRKTKVKAATLYYVFALTVEMESKLDASNLDDEATQRLAKMTLLILDEASMIDEPTWRAIRDRCRA